MKKEIKSVAISLLIVFAMYMWTTQPQMMSYNTLLNNSCQSLWVNGPSTVQQGVDFEFHVQAWDEWERLSSIYTGLVSFDLISYNLTTLNPFSGSWSSPASYQFTGALIEQGLVPGYKLSSILGKDCGRHTFIASISVEGIHYINVSDDKGHSTLSNPIIVQSTEPQLKLYWGDIHGHSGLCDGSGYLEDVWRFAKEIAYLDFAAVTTHDDWSDYFGTAPRFSAEMLWDLSKSAANRWNQPNKFVSLVAFEWTPHLQAYGHLCVYYKGENGPIFSSSYPEYYTQDKLWDALREWKNESGSDVITIPHHPSHVAAGMYYDWSYYDPEFVPLVEIYSAHGSSEKMNGLRPIEPGESQVPGFHVQDALSMGYQMGFIAGGDSHDGRIGHSLLHTEANNRFQYPYSMMALIGGFRYGEEYENGLVGVYAENLTREGIFDALKNRACLGTTHVSRPILNFTINGVSVGENDSTVYINSLTSPREIELFVAADGNSLLQNVTLIRNNVEINSTTPNSQIHRFTFNDTEALTGMNYTHGVEIGGTYQITEAAHKSLPEYSLATPPSTNWNGTVYSDVTDVYYMRVLQTNGDLSWIGPIWVKLK